MDLEIGKLLRKESCTTIQYSENTNPSVTSIDRIIPEPIWILFSSEIEMFRICILFENK